MKKKRNGFMLAELIITSTVVITALVALYATFNKIYSQYKEKNNYYDIDGIYATKEMIKTLMDNNFNTFINENLHDKKNIYIIEKYKNEVNNNEEENENNQTNTKCYLENQNSEITQKCTAIKDTYNIKQMIFAEYNSCNLNYKRCNEDNAEITNEGNLKVDNQTLKDYIDYIIDYYDIESTENQYNYIVITEREDENGKLYYSNLRIR